MQAATASAEEDDEDTDRGSSPMERTGEIPDYSGTWAIKWKDGKINILLIYYPI